jgi:pyruvate formate lyase activating enzyme
VIFMEYAMDVADACRERGIKAVAVSAGYMNAAPRAEFYAHIDAANIDLKAFSDTFYEKITFARLPKVLETLEYLLTTDVWFEVTTLLIPGHNDTDAEIAAECAWFAEHLGPDVPLHFSAFHPDFKMRDVPRTPPQTLRRARRIALDHGLRYVYTGNIHDPDGQTTRCPGCGTSVIMRDWYVMKSYDLTDSGGCVRCGATLPGRFDGPVGTWGGRRLPVRIAAAPTAPARTAPTGTAQARA